MRKSEMYSYRIRYQKKTEERLFYIKAENASSAVTDFLLRTGSTRECVISVEESAGREWKRVPF